MSEMNAQSYRNKLEDLLRLAKEDGYKFCVDIEATSYNDDTVEVNLEHYFIGKAHTDNATVSGDLIWEYEI